MKELLVLYEEGLDDDTITGSIKAISNSDTLIIGGISLVVYLIAELIDYFRGKNLVLINKRSTSAHSKANLVVNDSISEVLNNSILNLFYYKLHFMFYILLYGK